MISAQPPADAEQKRGRPLGAPTNEVAIVRVPSGPIIIMPPDAAGCDGAGIAVGAAGAAGACGTAVGAAIAGAAGAAAGAAGAGAWGAAG